MVGGALDTFIKIDVGANGTPTNYPSIELQNFAVQVQFIPTVTIVAEIQSTIAQNVQLILSTSTNAFDQTHLYRADYLVPSNTLQSLTLLPGDFIRWDAAKLVWFPTIAASPIYTYSGGSGSAVVSFEQVTIGSNQPMVSKVVLQGTGSNYAGAGLVLIGKGTRNPPRMYFQVTGQSIILRVRDGIGNNFDQIVAPGTWQYLDPSWDLFTYSTQQTNAYNASLQPDNTANIQAVEFVSNSSSTATVRVYWASINSRNDPERLDNYAIGYKGSIRSTSGTAHTLYVGTFRPVGSPSDSLPFNPGVVPFTVNTLDSGVTIDAWRGLPYAGYQSPHTWQNFGDSARMNQVLDFLLASQAAYTKSTGYVGFFAPVFKWSYWDAISQAADPGLNNFTWQGPDVNTGWCGYQVRPLESVAKLWYADPTNAKARQIVMNFLGGIDRFMLLNGTNRVPTDFKEGVAPALNYYEPHAAALVMNAAVLGNLSGGDPAITFRVLSRCYTFIKSQYVATGVMAGSFTAGQPDYVYSSVTYKENFAFWHFSILESLALLKQHRDDLIIGSCSDSL